MNAIRSPIAEVLARSLLPKGVFVASAGVRTGERDPFVDQVLAELSLTLGKRRPQSIDDLEGDYFDLVITLAPEAHHRALAMARSVSMDVEYWPMPDPSVATGSRNAILDAYRDVTRRLTERIKARFGLA
jgi:protein-tyrosine-phosphatase